LDKANCGDFLKVRKTNSIAHFFLLIKVPIFVNSAHQ
jgi:hypothetical protein